MVAPTKTQRDRLHRALAHLARFAEHASPDALGYAKMRRELVRAAADAGAGQRAIARALGVSRDRVRQLLDREGR
jgi:hypothetical protein